MKTKSKVNNNYIYMTEYVYKNYSYQTEQLKLVSSDINFSEFNDNYTSKYCDYLGGEVIFGKQNYKSDKNISLPSDLVIDRMGEICIVKPIEQYYIDYANIEWKNIAKKCVDNMNLSNYIKESLYRGIDWIKEWGVSRTFGLGTKIPFDEKFIIDSLSDSTIYPAYYTIAHLLHKDIYGKESEFNPNDFTNEVWDYIFYGIWNDNINIDKNKLDKMRESFEYFYPVDIRISGKDLLSNHLIMYIFNHCAIFEKKYYPKSIKCNGFILVDGEKMAKSKGNFITIETALKDNSVDVVRMTLADCGDGIDDANYETKKVSEINTLKLFTFVESIDKFIQDKETYNNDECQIDIIFNNIFNNYFTNVIKSYNNAEYKSVMRDIFHIINSLKEKYRIYCKYFDRKPNINIITNIIKNQIILLYPIIPHIAEYFGEKLNINFNDIDINKNNYNFDNNIIEKYNKMEENINIIREKYIKLKKKGKKYTNCNIYNIDFDEIEQTIIKGQIKLEFNFKYDDTNKFYTEFY